MTLALTFCLYAFIINEYLNIDNIGYVAMTFNVFLFISPAQKL